MHNPCVIELSAVSRVMFLFLSDPASSADCRVAAASWSRLRLSEKTMETLVTANSTM